MKSNKKKLYRWQARNRHNQVEQGLHQATKPDDVEFYLLREDLIPLKIKRYRQSLYQRYRARINAAFINQWTRQLAGLLNAHISLSESLTITVKTAEFYTQQHFIQGIKQNIEQGQSLSESLKQTRHFDPVYIAMIHAGEVSGELAQTLTRLADYQERNATLQRHIKNALIYPVMVLVFSTIITLIMLNFIVPQFSRFYASLNTPLPALTQFILTLSHTLKTISLTQFIGALLIMLLMQQLYKKYSSKLQPLRESIFTRLPIIGPIKQKNRLNAVLNFF